VDYDPARISYEKLLEIFWDGHDPTSQSWSRQYRNILFYNSDEQKELAVESRDRLASELKRNIVTELVPFKAFYPAEDYHQKHALRGYPGLFEEFRTTYPRIGDLISSTAAARVNGYLGGNGTCELLRSEIQDLGLSERGNRTLSDVVCGGSITKSCTAKGCN
jgi:peptide-methionine (S)-S-oxide reductase